MKLTPRDLEETKLVAALLKKVKQLDLTEVESISARMVEHQPYMMSLLLGYRFDVEKDQLDDVMRMLFLIYLFFERKTEIKKKQIDAEEFRKHQSKNGHYLKYLEGTKGRKAIAKINEEYLAHLRYISLFTGVIDLAQTQVSFQRIDPEVKGIVVLGMKTLIDCLEANLPERGA